MNTNILITISCICMLFIIGRIFGVPIKWAIKLVFNSILGGILIWIINLIGQMWGFHIGLNIYTSVLVRHIRPTRCNFFNYIKTNYRINIENSPIKGCFLTLNFFIKITISKIISFKFLTNFYS